MIKRGISDKIAMNVSHHVYEIVSNSDISEIVRNKYPGLAICVIKIPIRPTERSHSYYDDVRYSAQSKKRNTVVMTVRVLH